MDDSVFFCASTTARLGAAANGVCLSPRAIFQIRPGRADLENIRARGNIRRGRA
ncbi:hypothetical protein [Lysobacter capsici]|uniref:hypothetical protein n=1 Tax=Lysobacter capsici TaxID=435897 RepID=UPI00165101AC|nr:hypothetical protein [Lysobacter capsici]